MNESWLPVKGYEQDYFVSNLGKIKNRVKILKPSIDKDGYQVVSLYNKTRQKQFFLHRLVANAFIPNEEFKPQVNHIDGNKTNNEVKNLEWVTIKENIQHKYNILKYKNPPHHCKAVTCVETGETFKSFAEATKAKNIRRGGISSVIRGINNTTGGYHWVLKTNK